MFLRPLVERKNMRGSISIENISFSRNCDIKITNAKIVTDASIWIMCISKDTDTLGIAEHSLFISPFIIRRCGFHFRVLNDDFLNVYKFTHVHSYIHQQLFLGLCVIVKTSSVFPSHVNKVLLL